MLLTLSPTTSQVTWDWANHPLSTATYFNFKNDDTSLSLDNYISQKLLRVKFTFYGTNSIACYIFLNWK